MIAASLLSWQLYSEGGNGVRRCCKENETALVRPRFRNFTSHLRALNTKLPATQGTARQPYLNFDRTSLSEVAFLPHFFPFFKSISLLILFILTIKTFTCQKGFVFLLTRGEIFNALTSVKQTMKILRKVVEYRKSYNLPSVFLPAVFSIE